MFFSTGSTQYLRLLQEWNVKDVLISHAYRDCLVKNYELLRRNKVKLFFDSGAFTAWTQGKDVDVEAYKADLRKYDDLIEVAANIDVIPGQFGRKPTPEEVEFSAQKGWANYEMFKAEGFTKVIHIFHQGEDFKWLDKFIDNCEYFGVSPANDRSTNEKKEWLDMVFRRIETKGKKNRTHAFGVTSEFLMTRYPWYSVDSSSFAQHSAFGACFIPGYGVVRFSDKKQEDPAHISQRIKAEQDNLKEHCAARGFSIGQLKRDTYSRTRMNIISFLELEEKINKNGHETHYNAQTVIDFGNDFVDNNGERDADFSELDVLAERKKALPDVGSSSLEGVSPVGSQIGLGT